MKNKLKNKLNILLLIIVTIIVLYISLKDNFYEVVQGFKKLNIFWVIITLIYMFGYYFFRALSLHNFTRKFQNKITFKEILKIVFVTQFFDGITPSSTGGQPYQLYIFNKKGIKLTECTTIVIQNFIVYQIALILLGLIAVISNSYLNLFETVGPIKKLILLGFIINVIVMLALFSLAFLKKLNHFVLTLGIKILSKIKIIKDKNKKLTEVNEYIEQFINWFKKKCNGTIDRFGRKVYNEQACELTQVLFARKNKRIATAQPHAAVPEDDERPAESMEK